MPSGTLAGAVTLLVSCVSAAFLFAAPAALPEGAGLAAKYPGDVGIARDPAVVFTENFEEETLEKLQSVWRNTSNKGGKVLAFSADVHAASSGRRSLEMTATRGENEGGHLFTLLEPGYDRLFLRFYVKFGEETGFNHHFVSLGGEIDPPPYPVGRAGLRQVDTWNTGIEPMAASRQAGTAFPPPGIWHFYTYWPEMRSWQNADGTGTSFYGNNFEPREPAPVPRGRWLAVEIMVRMNSSPDAADGEQALWIDGKLVGRFGPGTIVGRWMRDTYRIDDENGTPFPGIRWRRDPRVKINKLWLSHYVSETAFQRTDQYADRHPEVKVDRRRATVFFDDLVVSREYVGPVARGR